MNNLIIDVGANHGDFCTEIAKRNSDIKVIAFEPEPSLYNLLFKKQEQLKNLKLYKFAIANVKNKEIRDFQVSHLGDMGVSSLLEFNKNHLEQNEYWNMRTDLKHDDTIQVEVVPLSYILDEINYDEIAFIKIDSQGFDLDILRSMGKHFNKIQAGMIEVPAVPSVSLYNQESETLIDALSFFKEKGYYVYQVKSNDEAGYEYNVYFHRNDINIKDLEHKYCLKNLPVYDGKNYWFLPSNQPTLNIDFNLINRISALETSFLNHTSMLETNLINQINRLESNLFDRIQIFENMHKPKCSIFRRLLSCFIPCKKLRRKIRGQYD